MEARTEYDIVMMSDLRLPGGTTASMAEEIQAQAAAGYRTALVHLSGPLVNKHVGIAQHLRRCIASGKADLVVGEPVHTRLAVLRHPSVFADPPAAAIDVTAERVVLVANNAATNMVGEPHYDPRQVTSTVAKLLGVAPTWHPIGPKVRASLEPWRDDIALSDDDWLNLINVDEWCVDRSRGVTGTPTIGRHSRPQAVKWPDRADEILAAYPDRDDVRVRVLGGAKPVRDALGAVPERWIVEDFGERDPRDFLSEVDFFVYFHRADLIEAYGRTIMEAMAAGAVAILPDHFRESFGDAAIYARPQDVSTIVERLTADRSAYLEQSQRGVEFVTRTHGYEVHMSRLGPLVGAPTGTGRPLPSRRRQRERARVLFVSSNGSGMGHLTRLLAMARRADDDVEPMFFSLSQAVPVVGRYGFPWEYCPSRGDLDLERGAWNEFFAGRFAEVVETYRPRALVFDGTWPYRGLLRGRDRLPDLLYVWSRRAMWREGTETTKLDESHLFDLVVEPGEFAAAADRGPTVDRRDARKVSPVTLLDPSDLLDRAQARDELGIDSDARALLVTLGAGNINDITSDLDLVVGNMRKRDGWTIFATKPPIARDGSVRGDVRSLSTYPLARYLNAFDGAVAASGYNSYHEMIMAGVPTVFVPNLATMTDDQLARARYAEQVGVGLCVEQVTPRSIAEAIDELVDDESAAAMRKRALDAYPGNGAGDAMRLVEELLLTPVASKGDVR